MMNVWRDPQLEAIPPTIAQIVDALLRAGEVWIVCRADNGPFPTLADMGLCQLPLAWPRCVSILGTDTLRLDLASFVTQVTGTTDKRGLSESDLERGFEILTGRKDREPVTLVVDAAERLTSEVIHYIQFATISHTALQVVFVTTREFRQRLKDFPFLCARLQPDLVIGAFPIQPAPAPMDERGQYEAECVQETEHPSGTNGDIYEPGASLIWIKASDAPNIERQELRSEEV